MGKGEKSEAKAISNRMKSKGLQRLRWYCQMCNKQCRDENGFKCHLTSEGHLRQMRLFAENPNKFVDEFSKDFERGYLEVLSHRHGTKRVLANRVYQEYIADKNHVHMNSTCWSSLTAFCMYLGKEGKAVVDETEKGWFVQYIDRDPLVLKRQLQDAQRKQNDMDDAEYMRKMIDAQMQAAALAAGYASDENEEDAYLTHSLQRSDDNATPISLDLKTFTSNSNSRKRSLIQCSGFDDEDSDTEPTIATTQAQTNGEQVQPPPKRKSNMELLIIDAEKRKTQELQQMDAKDRHDNWLHTGIIVKILNKTLLDGEVYKRKAIVEKIRDKYVGVLRILPSSSSSSSTSSKSDTRVLLDQVELETVIPKVRCV